LLERVNELNARSWARHGSTDEILNTHDASFISANRRLYSIETNNRHVAYVIAVIGSDPVFRAFFSRQCSSMVSFARESHRKSARSGSREVRAKNLIELSAGWPSGLSSPLATKTGISCVAKPKYQPVSSVGDSGLISCLPCKRFGF
jgi:hypothetical protein